MVNDSTTLSFKKDVKNQSLKTPRLSSLIFIRQFARVYMNNGNSELTSLIMN